MDGYIYQNPEKIFVMDKHYNKIKTPLQKRIMLSVTNGLGFNTLQLVNERLQMMDNPLSYELNFMDELTSGKESVFLMEHDYNLYIKTDFIRDASIPKEVRQEAATTGLLLDLSI